MTRKAGQASRMYRLQLNMRPDARCTLAMRASHSAMDNGQRARSRSAKPAMTKNPMCATMSMAKPTPSLSKPVAKSTRSMSVCHGQVVCRPQALLE